MIIKAIKGILFLLFVTSSNLLLGQENYQPGFLVKNTGDTVRGYVDYRNWEKNPKEIVFKESLEATFNKFSPIDIKSFGVINDIYESAIVKVDSLPYKADELSLSSKFEYRRDTIFLQTVMRGAKNLFFYKDKNSKEHFFYNENSVFVLLKFKEYIGYLDGQSKILVSGNVISTNNAGGKIVFTNNEYKTQLLYYLADCPSLKKEIKKLTYVRSSLEKIFKIYYACTGATTVVQNNEEKIKAKFGFVGGISITKLSFKSDIFPELTNANFRTSINPTFGVFADLVLPRNQGRWSINNEIIYSAYKTNGSYTKYKSAVDNEIFESEIAISYLKINSMARFKYPYKKISLFANLGISTGIVLSEVNTKLRTLNKFGAVRYERSEAIPEIKKNEFGFIGGVGLRYKQFSFETRLERGDGMSNIVALRGIPNRTYFLMAYTF